MTNVAISRRSDVVSRVEGDETLVLDLKTQVAHCLSGDVATVWNADEASREAVAAVTGLAIDAVAAAAESLAELGLVSAPAGLSRRTLVARGAVVGGAFVATVALPTAAMASSTPTITLSVTSGPMGWIVSVSGSGFAGTQVASVTFNSLPVSFSPKAISGGSFSGLTFAVPSGLSVGTLYTVRVTDNAATPRHADAQYTVAAPVVALSKSTFPKHTGGGTGSDSFTVTVTKPFGPSSSTTITAGSFSLVGATMTVSPNPKTTDTSGTFGSQTFTVTYSNGAYSAVLTFTDSFGNTTTASVSTA